MSLLWYFFLLWGKKMPCTCVFGYGRIRCKKQLRRFPSKTRGSIPAVLCWGREIPVRGVTCEAALSISQTHTPPLLPGFSAALLNSDSISFLFQRLDLPEARTVRALGSDAGSPGDPRWILSAPRPVPGFSCAPAGSCAGPSQAALFLSLFTRFQWQLHHRVSVRLELGLGLFWLHWSFCFSAARFKWWLHQHWAKKEKRGGGR